MDVCLPALEFYPLRSAGFRDWLVDGFVATGGKTPSQSSVRRVIATLESRARLDRGTPSLAIRVGREPAHAGGRNCIDLGDPTGRAVVFDESGWIVVDRPAAAFQRPEGFLPLPVPCREGSIELLRPYVNLTERDFRLLLVWLAAALRPVGPYPILALQGEQGSAKSTLAKIARSLVDPQDAPLLVEPKSTRDLMVTALNGWLLAYDNISAVPRWLSDGLCQVATGGAYAGRTEFTSLERTTIKAQRPVILNGIDEFVKRGDLLDRAVILHLPPIAPAGRRREDKFWEAFEQDRPRIFGGLLDAMVGGLRELPGVELVELPRMADFAVSSEAIGRGLGWPPGSLLIDYEASTREATAAQIEDSLVGTVLLQGAVRLGAWTGSPADLLTELTATLGRKTAASARWPKSPEKFATELRRIAPQLRMLGLNMSFGRSFKGRFVTFAPAKSA